MLTLSVGCVGGDRVGGARTPVTVVDVVSRGVDCRGRRRRWRGRGRRPGRRGLGRRRGRRLSAARGSEQGRSPPRPSGCGPRTSVAARSRGRRHEGVGELHLRSLGVRVADLSAMVSRPGDRGPASSGTTGLRKVGTPQGRVLANGQSGRPAGKCHREQTADGPVRRAQARVKRCGKSAPAPGVTRVARQTPPGARPNVGYGRPVRHSPGSDNPLVGRTDGWSHRRREALDRIPPTGRLAIAHTPDQGRRPPRISQGRVWSRPGAGGPGWRGEAPRAH